jgi:hypothetical protein
MYAVLVKNDSATWDVIGLLDYSGLPEKAAVIDEALESGLPITGMETTPFKNTARTGSIWNGTSFSGGSPLSPDANDSDEYWDTVKKYSLLCNNKLISSIIVLKDGSRAPLYEAAFATEVNLVKVPSDQSVFIGETYGWDGSKFTNPE